MTGRISGILINPDGSPLANTQVTITSVRNKAPSMLERNQFSFVTGDAGEYDEILEPGYYKVTSHKNELGEISILSDTDTNLPALLMAND